MAKNTVTEKDLLAGVGGGFGTITQMGAGRPIRDNPFRDTRSEAPVEATVERRVEPQETRVAERAAKPVARSTTTATPAQRPAAPELPAPSAPTPERPARARPVKKALKTETFSEKISTFLTPEMRDELEMTARLLQRNRLVKGDSITAHTLIRCGVRVMTGLLEFTDADVVSSEEELDALVRRKLGF